MKIEDLKFEKEIDVTNSDALLIVDMQYDFMPGGALAVEEGDKIIPGINKIGKNFQKKDYHVVLTQDWHPKGHMSFASSYPDKKPGDEFDTKGIGPVLWPDHCVQGSKGAKIHEDIEKTLGYAIIRKGYHPKVDSYSAFLENDKKTETGLRGYLESLNIRRIFLCGLALDYCCFASAIDAVDFGFHVCFLPHLSKAIDDPPGNLSTALTTMTEKGVKFVKLEDLKF
ncbi:MAG: bifunctional nicotinamidase/pyrazinamidase [Promethearchaeia archaeon]